MASEKETVAEVAKAFGDNIALMRKCKCVGVSLWNCLKFKLRFEAAHEREIAAKDAEIVELRAIVNAECRKCGECAKFGKDCMAGDIDGSEDHRACEKFVSREIAELRKCLRLSSNSMEMVVQWLGKYPKWQECLKNGVARNRKALEGANDETK